MEQAVQSVFTRSTRSADRYLEFERWWGGHVTLNAEEIQAIVDELFVGNKLAACQIKTADGTAVDLRNIRSPIVVFCSKGDNITPPQQALGWILDLYENVDEIRSFGQTIVYTIHETVGHLGIFVSTGTARKEHNEFASNIDFIDVLPPGLYEAVIEPKSGTTENADLAHGEWVMRCEARTLDDIRALGGNDAADERRFATAAKVSEANLALYRTFAQPVVRAMVSGPAADWLQRMHPLRLQYELFSDANPVPRHAAPMAEEARKDRKPAAADNPFHAWQTLVSRQIVSTLDAWRDASESLSEQMFLVGLRLAVPSGRGRHRSRLGQAVAPGAEERAASRTRSKQDCRAEIAHRHRRPARGGGPGPALCRHGPEAARTSAASR